jgi:hypothetical protein
VQHPFISNLSDKSLEELQKTLSDLTGKLTFAYRMGNGALIHQLNMAIDSYRTAYNDKMNEMIKAQKINTKISIDKK